MACRRAQSPTMPSTTRRAPGSIPAIWRRPWNTNRILPVPSARTHSRFALPALGWVRTELTRPAIRTRSTPLHPPDRRGLPGMTTECRSFERRIRCLAVRGPPGRPLLRAIGTDRRRTSHLVIGRPTNWRASLREPAAGELIGHHGGVHMVELRNRRGNAVGRAVVEQAMPTSGEPASREEDGQFGLLVGYRLGRKLKDGPARAAGPRIPRHPAAVGRAQAGSSRPRAPPRHGCPT